MPITPTSRILPPTRRKRTTRGIVIVVLALVAAAGAFVYRMPAPVVTIGPGQTADITNRMQGHADPGFGTSGAWLWTAVSEQRPSWCWWLIGRAIGRHGQQPRASAPPESPPAANRSDTDRVAMASSKRLAWTVATQILDPVSPSPAVVILNVTGHGAAARAGFRAGDRIIEIDGQPAGGTDQASAQVVTDLGPIYRLTVLRGNQRLQIPVALNPRNPWADLGVDISDDSDANPPWPIDTGNVSGPSAGLVFSLAYIDAARPADLTAGLRVAATGTINATEEVGDIGGIHSS